MSEHSLQAVQEMIDSDNVVIFSKSYCPYCEEVKKICTGLRKPFTSYELDKIDDGANIQSILEDITGAKTVPRIFVEGKFVGGASDFQELYDTGDIYDVLNVKKTGWFSSIKGRFRQMFLQSDD